ncbi:uncharacterized protein LOC127288402 [Leptopilina boulardi]|uniref:uncharacterized protein LOC127288402 n=1 Tax=Leptopilina boulardi TaxID=63433 RepID=UPI0021F5934A|nr:uncharacterized protein LOC127288402 [Leptopilina boulardi]
MKSCTLLLLCVGLFVLVNSQCEEEGRRCRNDRDCCENLRCQDRKCARREGGGDCQREGQRCRNDQNCCRNLRCHERKCARRDDGGCEGKRCQNDRDCCRNHRCNERRRHCERRRDE